jgi:hypothetical protein
LPSFFHPVRFFCGFFGSMKVLWSTIGEETDFVLVFPDTEGQLTIAAAPPSNALLFRLIVANAHGREPVLFVRARAHLEPLRVWSNPAVTGASVPGISRQTDIVFKTALNPSAIQLFLGHVGAESVAFEVGPRIIWPKQHPVYDPKNSQAVAKAIRETSDFSTFLAQAESRKATLDEAIFITATPLIEENGELIVAPALDLWPRLALTASVRATRNSNRMLKRPGKTAIAEQFGRVAQPFQDALEIEVEGDSAVAKSLVLCQVRRQSVARAERLARAEPEIEKIVVPELEAIEQHPLKWQINSGRQVAVVESMVAARGDWFLLISPDAQLDINSLQSNGREWLATAGTTWPVPVTGFQPAKVSQRAMRMVVWRHDGQSLTVFSDEQAMKSSSDKFSGGLVDQAIGKWTDRNPGLQGLWGIAFAAFKAMSPSGRASRADFMSRLVDIGGSPFNPQIAQHSPFVALAALVRWEALDRLATSDRWKAGIGRDDRSIERLVSPVAEWLVSPGRKSVAPPKLIVPAATNDDAATHLLRWIRSNDRIGVKDPPDAIVRLEPQATAAVAVLLLSGRLQVAEQAESIGAALSLRDATDPGVPELIKVFVPILSGNKLNVADDDLAFYRAMITLQQAGPRPARHDALLQALYRGTRALTDYFTVDDLNGGSLVDFDLVAAFKHVSGGLTKAFPADMVLRVCHAVRTSTTHVIHSGFDHISLRALAQAAADKYIERKPGWNPETFRTEIDQLAAPGAATARDHARQALVALWLLETQRQSEERSKAAKWAYDNVDLAKNLTREELEADLAQMAVDVGAPFASHDTPNPPGAGLHGVIGDPDDYDVDRWIAACWHSLDSEQEKKARRAVGLLIAKCARRIFTGTIKPMFEQLKLEFMAVKTNLDLDGKLGETSWKMAERKFKSADDLYRRATRNLNNDARDPKKIRRHYVKLLDAISEARSSLTAARQDLGV